VGERDDLFTMQAGGHARRRAVLSPVKGSAGQGQTLPWVAHNHCEVAHGTKRPSGEQVVLGVLGQGEGLDVIALGERGTPAVLREPAAELSQLRERASAVCRPPSAALARSCRKPMTWRRTSPPP
jgi:hypothetical protein